jgi:hypothetical protein
LAPQGAIVRPTPSRLLPLPAFRTGSALALGSGIPKFFIIARELEEALWKLLTPIEGPPVGSSFQRLVIGGGSPTFFIACNDCLLALTEVEADFLIVFHLCPERGAGRR